MKTVQEVLRQADENELISNFLYEHPNDLDSFNNNLTIAEAKEREKKVLHDYIKRLREMKITAPKDGKTWIFYAYHYSDNGFPKPIFNLCNLEELRAKKINSKNYGITFIDQSEILGYYLAENHLTNFYLKELLVHILYEASFFGTNQEGLPAFKKDMDKSIKEIENNETLDWENFKKELGLTEVDKFTDKEQKFRNQIHELDAEIINLSQSDAIEEILVSLEK